MKKILLLSLCLAGLFVQSAFAQFVPQGFNYQTVLRNANGTALANQSVVLLFTLKSGAPNGPVAYAEKQVATTNELGLINLAIGIGGTPLQGDFAAINWGGGSKYLTIATETSPNFFEELGTTQLMSVPYAMYALNAANGGGSGGGDNWGTDFVHTDLTLTGNGTAPNKIGIAQQGAAPGQVLKWDGAKWAPSDDVANFGTNGGTVTQVNTGAGLTGGPITVDGTISLSPTGVTPGTWGSASQIPVFTVDAQGRITNVFTVVPSPGTIGITGNTGITVQQNGFNFTLTNTGDTNPFDDVTTNSFFGGDVSGVYSNLQINQNTIGTDEIINQSVLGTDINRMDAATGQVLKWNGNSWSPQEDNGSTTVGITGGVGITVSGNHPFYTVTNTGDTNPNDDLTALSQHDGDVSGTFNNLQIKTGAVGSPEITDLGINTADLNNAAVTAAKLNDMGAQSGQVLKWNGASWAPAVDQTSGGGGSTTVSAGTGISVLPNGSNFTVTNTGDINPADDLTTASLADGDVSGPFSNLQIKNGAVGSSDLNNMGATPGQVLKWSGSAWVPSADLTGGGGGSTTVAPGPGIDVSQSGSTFTVTNLGDLDPFDDINDNTQADGDISGIFSNLQIKNGAVGTIEIAPAAITSSRIAQMNATSGQVLKWNGAAWAPAADLTGGGGTSVVGGAGIAVSQNGNTFTVTNTGDTNPNDDLSTTTNYDGDVSGIFSNLQLKAAVVGNPELANAAVNGAKIAQMGANNGQVLKWNGLTWAPADDNGGIGGGYQAGPGIAISGGANPTISNTGDLSATNEIQAITLTGNTLQLSSGGGSVTLPSGTGNNYGAGAGVTVTGLAPNFLINALDVSPTNELQTISVSGTQLTLSQGGGTVTIPAAVSYAAGTAISITGTAPNLTINNTGDINPSNELQNLTLLGNTLSLSQNGGAVTLPSGTGNNYGAGAGISITGFSPNFTVNALDVSPTNELQNLALNGTNLSISGGNTVSLAALGGGGNNWALANTHISNTNTGNVGIGLAAPPVKLTVQGNGTVLQLQGQSPRLNFVSTGSTDAYISSDPGNLTIGTVSDNLPIIIAPGSHNIPAITAMASGNVAIKGRNPGVYAARVFHDDWGLNLFNSVSGHHWEIYVSDQADGRMQLFNDQSGNVPVGTFAVNGIYNPSDKRLKKDIAPMASVMDKLLKIKPVTYRYKQQAEAEPMSLGFLAQDVRAEFPELVTEVAARDTKEKFLALNYAGFGVLAVKAVQEQQREIELLRGENAALRVLVEKMEARLGRLEKEK